MDVPSWTDEMSECVKSRFYTAIISVHSSSESLSGFNVVVKVPPPPYVSIAGAALFLATMSACVAVWWTVLN